MVIRILVPEDGLDRTETLKSAVLVWSFPNPSKAPVSSTGWKLRHWSIPLPLQTGYNLQALKHSS